MQNIKKYFMTLALLLTAVGGAWADETPLLTIESKDYKSFTSGSMTFDEKVTVTFSIEVSNDGDTDGWYTDGGSLLTVAGINGYTITSCKFYTKYGDANTGYTVEGESPSVFLSDDNVSTDANLSVNIGSPGIKKIEVYGTAPAAEPTEWSLTPDETGKSWTLAKMPASDVELQVEYYAESNLFLSKDALADKTNIAVTAGELGVQFGDDGKSANTVTEGTPMTVTYNGTKKVIGFKAAKKAPTEGHALSASEVGEIVGSDGKAYAVADKDNLPSGVTAVAMVAYKSGSNGLAIQLNSSPVEKTWADAKTYPEGLTAVPGGTWRLPSMVDWQNMFVGCAVSGDAGASDFMDPIKGFNAKIDATGIAWVSYNYWSSTGTDLGAWYVFVYLGDTPAAAFYQNETSDEYKYLVLGCLAF